MDWRDDQQKLWRAGMARDELIKRIVELEAEISVVHGATRRHSFDCEWYLQGVRHDPGDYVLMRVGPATTDVNLF